MHNHYHAFDALTAILTGDKPTLSHWTELANIANLLEALRLQGEIYDEQGLIPDCMSALKAARQRPTIRLDGAGRNAMILMLEQYVNLCKNISVRAIKSAVNYAANAQQHTRNL